MTATVTTCPLWRRARLAALTHAAALAAVMPAAAPLVAHIPLAARAGVLMATAVPEGRAVIAGCASSGVAVRRAGSGLDRDRHSGPGPGRRGDSRTSGRRSVRPSEDHPGGPGRGGAARHERPSRRGARAPRGEHCRVPNRRAALLRRRASAPRRQSPRRGLICSRWVC